MENLRSLREAKKITQSQLGEYLGAKKSAISLWESGKRQPDQETLVRIANYFDVTVDYLLGREEETTPAQEKAPADLRAEAKKLLEDMDDDEYALALAILRKMKGKS
jgi:transcriptional regulator with XRE-family HTH domain